ncbi:MAG: hypothetical protein PHV68_04860 [Candidatus Gastranaerophilales bacterium]|nr:hypothetical protein [Candidatus Gastranaerophilales bacterium]
MQVNFTPINFKSSQNKAQKTTFGALDIPKITKNDFEAETFAINAARGRVKQTPENEKDLLKAIEIAEQNKNKKGGVYSYLLEVARDDWKILK